MADTEGWNPLSFHTENHNSAVNMSVEYEE